MDIRLSSYQERPNLIEKILQLTTEKKNKKLEFYFFDDLNLK